MPNPSKRIGLPTPAQLKARVDAAKQSNNVGIGEALDRVHDVIEQMLTTSINSAIADVKSDSKLSDIRGSAELYGLTGQPDRYGATYYNSPKNQLKSLLGEKYFSKLTKDKRLRDDFAKKYKSKLESENPGWTFDVRIQQEFSDPTLKVMMYISSTEKEGKES